VAISAPQVLIIEMGGQLTQKIARVARNAANVRSITLDPRKAEIWLAQNPVKGIILSGSGSSVRDKDAPRPPVKVFSLKNQRRPVPILGICYGMQWLTHHFHGGVEKKYSEYGPAQATLTSSVLFKNTPAVQRVWMSHGDSVVSIPDGFQSLGRSSSGAFAAMVNLTKNIWAVQFHPEAAETDHGDVILTNFIREICGCSPDWEPSNIVDDIRSEIDSGVGGAKVVLPFSGGVDSCTATKILAPVLGARLKTVTFDGDNLRLNEEEEITAHALCCEATGWELIDARTRFVAAVSKTIDAGQKRLNFRQVYADLIRGVGNRFVEGSQYPLHVVQGSIAPDLIESGKTGGHSIVTHHNTGLHELLSEFVLIDPLRNLFKPEVRELAESLGLPPSIYKRQPFPGPGLYVRTVGTPATHEMLELVRWLDWTVTNIIKEHGLYDEISQLVVAYLHLTTSGVKGDAPFHAGSVGVRPFKTTDFMTGEGYFLPEPVVRAIDAAVIKDSRIVSTFFKYTPKPPARVEFE
jgi:GMP synthase (glutamine-hydrolysing)